MNKNEEMKKLEEICSPVVDYLKKNWDPHCTVVITDSHIKLLRDQIGILTKTAPEVPVQEQHRFVPTDSSGTIYSEDELSIKCQSN